MQIKGLYMSVCRCSPFSQAARVEEEVDWLMGQIEYSLKFHQKEIEEATPKEFAVGLTSNKAPELPSTAELERNMRPVDSPDIKKVIPSFIHRLEREQKTASKSTVLVLLPSKDDEYSTLYGRGTSYGFAKCFQSLNRSGCKIVPIWSAKPQEMARQVEKKQRKASLPVKHIVVFGHGDQQEIILSGSSKSDATVVKADDFAKAFSFLPEWSTIFLVSCCTGEPGGLAQQLAQKLKGKKILVTAPSIKIPSAWPFIIPKSTPLSMGFFTPFDFDPTRIYCEDEVFDCKGLGYSNNFLSKKHKHNLLISKRGMEILQQLRLFPEGDGP
jgi:hypothetical protein